MRYLSKILIILSFGVFFPTIHAEGAQKDIHSNQASEDFAPARPKCPGVLEHLVNQEDKEGGVLGWLTGGITVSNCTDSLVKGSLLPSPEALESSFQNYAGSSLEGVPQDFIERCLTERNGRKRGKKFSDDEKRAIISDYYWAMAQLSQQGKANLESIVSIDLALGETGSGVLTAGTSNNMPYSSKHLPGTEKFESKLKQCPAALKDPSTGRTQSMEQMIEQTQIALRALAKIDEELKNLPSRNVTPSQVGDPSAMPSNEPDTKGDRYKALQKARELVISSAPWLRGTEGQTLLKEMKSSPNSLLSGSANSRNRVAEVLKAQLLANRKAMHKQIQDLNKASECFHSRGNNFACVDEQREIFDRLPAYNPKEKIFAAGANGDEESLSSDEQKRVMFARGFLSSAECRYKQRANKKAVYDDSRDLAINSGITIATAGLGAVVSAGKVAVAAGRAAQISRTVRAAQMAIFAVDIRTGAQGISQTYQACNKALEGHLSQNPELMQGSENPSCGNLAEQSQLVTNYKECYVQAALAGVGILTTIPGNIALFKGVRTPTERIKAMGFDDQTTNDIVRSLAQAEKPKFNVSRWVRGVPEKNLLVLDTLEQLSPNFIKSVQTTSHRKALVDTLSEMQSYFGDEWKPGTVAKFMNSIGDSGEDGLLTLSRAFGEADKILQQKPSLGTMGALKAYLNKIKMSEADSQKLLNCLSAATR